MSATKKQRTDSGTETALDQLKKTTVVVADTGEFNVIEQFKPQDATTNPSLILKAALIPEYASLVDDAVNFANSPNEYLGTNASESDRVLLALDYLSVNIGSMIAKVVPGYVSTEVDARLSFDTQGTVDRARRMLSIYEKSFGVDKSRILVKIASTYEGIRAGEILEKEGVTCNLTLLFSLIQAAACAEANITLISAFVGRVMDWHKAKTGKTYAGDEDPGVISVVEIYKYLRKFGFNTILMGKFFF